MRSPTLLLSTLILVLLLALCFTPPSTSQIKKEVEDESSEILERIKWFKKRHPDVAPELRLKRVRDEYQSTEAFKKRIGPRPMSAATSWVSLGPSNGAGRINAVAVHPTAMGTVYVAANSGGVWKTTDNGETWTNLTDSINNLNVGAITLAPSSPNVIYVGTGSEHAGGIGLLKSVDGGATWQFPSSVVASRFFRISVHPTNPLELVAATSGAGVLRSTDGGNSWTVGLPHNPYNQVTDLKRDPTNPLVLYAAAFTSEGGRVLKSTDGGTSFTEKMSGLPAVPDYMSIAITPSDPRILYLLTADFATSPRASHVFKSTDAAETWQDLAGFSNNRDLLRGQASHDNTIVVSPSNPNEITVGGVTYSRSLDGGETWFLPFCQNFNCFSVHVDWTDQQYQGSTLWIANDGGVYRAQGNIVTEHNQGLGVREYYAMSNHDVVTNSFLAGSQDNGVDWRPGSGGTELLLMPFCDGFDSAIDPQNPAIAYATCQSGRIRRTRDFGINPNIFFGPTTTLITPPYPSSEGKPFATRLVMDQNQPSTLYTVSQRLVWKTTDQGDSWTALPNGVSDGSTLDSLEGVAVAKSNGNVLMAWSGFQLYRSTDGGMTWATKFNGKSIQSVEIDPSDSNVIYVGSIGPCFECSGVFMSTDGGDTWTPRGNGLPPAFVVVLTIEVDPLDSNTLYCGTFNGVFTTTG
jgi:photosystem II stability/assembly factor-like uncharacterized protein